MELNVEFGGVDDMMKLIYFYELVVLYIFVKRYEFGKFYVSC